MSPPPPIPSLRHCVVLHVDPEGNWSPVPLWPASQGHQQCRIWYGRHQIHPGQVLQGVPPRECTEGASGRGTEWFKLTLRQCHFLLAHKFDLLTSDKLSSRSKDGFTVSLTGYHLFFMIEVLPIVHTTCSLNAIEFITWTYYNYHLPTPPPVAFRGRALQVCHTLHPQADPGGLRRGLHQSDTTVGGD